jgi:DNA-binding transcriptional ArsR family regulator
MKFSMNEQTIFDIQAELCRAMGNPLRMEIMHLLRSGPMNVNDIASATHTHQTTISRNLATLRNAGIVVAHREGTNTIYEVANPKIVSVCNLMREVLSEQIGEHSKLMGETNE